MINYLKNMIEKIINSNMSFFMHNILEKVINFQKKSTEKNNKFEHFVLTRKYEEKKLIKFFIPLNVDFLT